MSSTVADDPDVPGSSPRVSGDRCPGSMATRQKLAILHEYGIYYEKSGYV